MVLGGRDLEIIMHKILEKGNSKIIQFDKPKSAAKTLICLNLAGQTGASDMF